MYNLKEVACNSPQSANTNVSTKDKGTCINSSGDTNSVRKTISVETECVDTPQHLPDGHSQQNILRTDTKPVIASQVIASLVMALVEGGSGIVMAFSGITLLQLTDQQTNDLFLNQSQAALFGSLVHLGGALGSCVSGPLLVKLGRRLTLLVTLPITLASWLTLALSPTVWLLLTSRAILGITIGIMFTATFLYTIEIAHKNIRGILSGILTLTRQLGFILVSALGVSKLDWRQMSFVSGGMTTFPLFCLLFLPNSPRWLVTHGRLSEAHKSLVFFRGKHCNCEPELLDITQQISNVSREVDNSWQQVRLLFEPSTGRVFFLLTFLTILHTMNGFFAISTYLMPIFKAVEASLDPYTSA
nr:facilitated trehalose transporter Tret1-like [Cherax quadricarinatus]